MYLQLFQFKGLHFLIVFYYIIIQYKQKNESDLLVISCVDNSMHERKNFADIPNAFYIGNSDLLYTDLSVYLSAQSDSPTVLI